MTHKNDSTGIKRYREHTTTTQSTMKVSMIISFLLAASVRACDFPNIARCVSHNDNLYTKVNVPVVVATIHCGYIITDDFSTQPPLDEGPFNLTVTSYKSEYYNFNAFENGESCNYSSIVHVGCLNVCNVHDNTVTFCNECEKVSRNFEVQIDDYESYSVSADLPTFDVNITDNFYSLIVAGINFTLDVQNAVSVKDYVRYELARFDDLHVTKYSSNFSNYVYIYVPTLFDFYISVNDTIHFPTKIVGLDVVNVTEEGAVLVGSSPGTYLVQVYYGEKVEFNFTVNVIVPEYKSQEILSAIIFAASFVTTLCIGCDVDIDDVRATVKKLSGPAIGLFLQVILMPATALFLAKFVIVNVYVGFGLLLLGCCPGGTSSNLWTYAMGGDVALSAAMTSISSMVTLVTLPGWLLVGQHVILDASISVPYIEIISVISINFIALLMGILIGKTPYGKYGPRYGLPVFALVKYVLVICVTVMFSPPYLKLVTYDIAIACSALPLFGAVVGGSLAGVFRLLTADKIIAVSIETALQNSGVAFIILQRAFDQPTRDIATIAPIVTELVTNILLLTAFVISLVFRYQRYGSFSPVQTRDVKNKSRAARNGEV